MGGRPVDSLAVDGLAVDGLAVDGLPDDGRDEKEETRLFRSPGRK